MRRLTAPTILVLAVAALPAAASAQTMPAKPDQPPGVEMQVQSLMTVMMQHMQDMDMSPQQVQMMMADVEMAADQLPPGDFLQLLKLMTQMDMEDMMALHEAIHGDGLLSEPPGQIIAFASQLVR